MFNNWVYMIVVIASALGFSAGRYLPQYPTGDLERQLQEAHQRIEELKLQCQPPALPRVEIKRPLAGKEF